uniref:Hypothetical conserved protein n=1 Tax=uncultured Chloroflexota bacterium TaxID=166587 RepID=H5SQ57_9CHLR|nr:hypothetical conserved protein [uncultured Chloroflexota bacterium]
MDAIVTAGGIPLPEDPLYSYSKGEPKALIDVAGKPMVQWVLDALSDAQKVERVVLIGLSPKSPLSCKKPLYFLSNQGSMLRNIIAGMNKVLELNPAAEYVLIVSSDIPGIKAFMVDWLIETAMQTQDDLYYGVVPREVMEKRYPNSRRTYTRLKDIEVCGADINIARVQIATQNLDLWERLIGSRKSPLQQAAILGLDTLFLLLTRQITLQGAVEKVSKRLNLRGRVIVWEHAEAGMDVDKPHQLEILRADLSGKGAAAIA